MKRDLARSAAIWFVVIPFVHGAIPWMLSTLTPRFGWKDHIPGDWNWFGLPVITASAALVGYSFWWRRRQVPASSVHNLQQAGGASDAHPGNKRFLMREGPYRISRNPIYVGYLGSWLGWSIVFGSPAVFAGLLILCLIASKYIVPAEERALEFEFGDAYTDYKKCAPRWLGMGSG